MLLRQWESEASPAGISGSARKWPWLWLVGLPSLSEACALAPEPSDVTKAAKTSLSVVVACLAPITCARGDSATGRRLFANRCLACHGESGRGDGPIGTVLSPRPPDFAAGEFRIDTDGDGRAGTDADLANVIRDGPAAYGGSPIMPPSSRLSDEELSQLIVHLRSLEH